MNKDEKILAAKIIKAGKLLATEEQRTEIRIKIRSLEEYKNSSYAYVYRNPLPNRSRFSKLYADDKIENLGKLETYSGYPEERKAWSNFLDIKIKYLNKELEELNELIKKL